MPIEEIRVFKISDGRTFETLQEAESEERRLIRNRALRKWAEENGYNPMDRDDLGDLLVEKADELAQLSGGRAMTGRRRPDRLLPFALEGERGSAKIAAVEVMHRGRLYRVSIAATGRPHPEAEADGVKVTWADVPSVVRVTAFHALGLYHAGLGNSLPGRLHLET